MNAVPRIDLAMNLPVDLQHAMMRDALSRNLRPFIVAPEHAGTLCIVGNAPSLGRTLANLRSRQRKGAKIMTVQGADGVLIRAGIIPDWVAGLDSTPLMAGLITPHEAVTYLIASQCHPELFEFLKDRKVVLWHANNDRGERELMEREYPHLPWVLVSGGCSVGLRCFNLGYLLGFRRFHVYGMDSSMPANGSLHAVPGPADERVKAAAFDVTCAGRQFLCPPQYAQQAQDFVWLMRDTFKGKIDVRVHGDGLIPHIAKTMRAAGELRIQQRKELT